MKSGTLRRFRTLEDWSRGGSWLHRRDPRFKLLSALVLLAAIAVAPTRSFTSLLLASAVGIAILLIFIRFENRVESPALDLSLFKHNRVFAFSNLAAAKAARDRALENLNWYKGTPDPKDIADADAKVTIAQAQLDAAQTQVPSPRRHRERLTRMRGLIL